MRVGEVEIHLLTDGSARIDGGGMFGVVPKVMWERAHPADELNLIPMRINSLLIKDGEHTILVDTGFGGKIHQRSMKVLGITETGLLPQRLRERGVDPSEVNLVINTHLHFDHNGGNTRQEKDRLSVAFPNATYIAQRGEWENANNPNERTKVSYRPENLLPIQEAGRLELIEGNTQITPHLRCLLTPGHTPWHQSVLIESEGEQALYVGDLACFAVHMERLPWVAAYDLDPVQTIETRRWIQRWAVEERILLVFPHDPEIDAGYLRSESGRYWVEPVGSSQPSGAPCV